MTTWSNSRPLTRTVREICRRRFFRPRNRIRSRARVSAAARTVGSSPAAAALHLSEGTVRNHLSSAIGKTGARTRAEAVRLADEAGWLL